MSKYPKQPIISSLKFTQPRKCPVCKRPAKKVTRKVYSNEPYDGNMVLVRSIDYWKSKDTNDNHERNPDYDLYKRYEHIVWDGETYVHRYGFFCSQPCAVWYANNHLTLDRWSVQFKDLPEVVL